MASPTLFSAQGVVTNAQLKAMNANSLTHFVSAIPAPGANLTIVPIQIILWTTSGAAYAFGGFAPLLAFMYRGIFAPEAYQFLESTILTPGEIGFQGSASPQTSVSAVTNLAMGFNLSQLGDNNPPTGGAGTDLHYTVLYTIAPTA